MQCFFYLCIYRVGNKKEVLYENDEFYFMCLYGFASIRM